MRGRVMRLWLLANVLAGASGEPLQVATEGRLFLLCDPSSPPLADVSSTSGTVREADWLATAAERARHLDVSFPLTWWKWTELGLRFTPQADGVVDLRLIGPWAETGNGQLWRQEVLWDDIAATGATIENGDFSKGISGWDAWGYPDPAGWPVEGRELGASWHNRPLSQRITVKAGQAVVLKLKARAATPPDFVKPKVLEGVTPAHKALSTIKRGVNLGNGWEAEPGTWGQPFTVQDIEDIAAAKFDHIRVPVAWHFHLRDGKIQDHFFDELDPVLRRALDKGLTVLLNWHHFDQLCEDPDGQRELFLSGWEQIATHYRSWPDKLWLELLNEPMGKLEASELNKLYAVTIPRIRRLSPQRILVVNSAKWSQVGTLSALRLPDNDDRLVVSVHCYDPFEFTHQGASWANLTPLKGVIFPGPPAQALAVPPELKERAGLAAWLHDYNTRPTAENPSSDRVIRQKLNEAAEWSKAFGRPVHLGEFGAYQAADLASRKRYARAATKAAEDAGLPWCWWEWSAGFGVVEGRHGKPLLLEELMGK